jgi:hypothetical protein
VVSVIAVCRQKICMHTSLPPCLVFSFFAVESTNHGAPQHIVLPALVSSYILYAQHVVSKYYEYVPSFFSDTEISDTEAIILLSTYCRDVKGRAIAQAVSRRLITVVARVRAQVRSRGICGGQSDTVAGFLLVVWFSLPILIPPTASYSTSSIVRVKKKVNLSLNRP